VVAIVGAGGKTTLAYGMAAEARSRGLSVIVTTTTHMGALAPEITGPLLVEEDGDPGPALAAALRDHGRATLLGRRVRPDKLEGIAPERVDELARRACLVIVEADGARQRSLKLPAPHEPVVPASTTLLLVVAAVDALGQPLDERYVHRLELVCAATGRAPGEIVDESAFASALLCDGGYRARVPSGARLGLFLNKVEDWDAASRLAARLRPAYDIVVAGSARSGECRRL
jgi:probable selenium-dependent hydroxylase accessory protein YqeC